MGFFDSFSKEILDDVLGVEPKRIASFADKVLDIEPPKAMIASPVATPPIVAAPTTEAASTLDSWMWVEQLMQTRRQIAQAESLVPKEQAQTMAPGPATACATGEAFGFLIVVVLIFWVIL